MDNSTLNSANLDISRLSDADKRDLQQQIGNEMQKAKLQECAFSSSSIPSPVKQKPPPPPTSPSN
ncbi:MAG: hypothetical protein Q9218_007507, partial [Villophora microphyllina]